ncbi:outer dynein arm-docking complex subunit 1 [Chlorella sorokiniana]|uniref:Outer dynein arm-docking complex subunit 1 n=1 Tax=Chlorella sorokiniana TaxID=3076 RepID=A0A2P6TGI6_CHLSO|nr:outer dynein arm-docking complex subunit 1 [Chlorella sorokiniana]|eukprot:PRW33225.1 outer dynein arm-docking complex subunit 1 [Chlorella sorokiniana]
MKKSALRLPKLKTRDELLRTAPELGRLLAADGEAVAPPLPGRAASPLRARSPTGRRAGSPRRIVRKFSDDELTEEERVRADLEKVKAERAALLDSLAKLRADVGKSGGELQQEDIRLLRRELAAKQEKLNELRRATHELSDTVEQLETTSRDCEALMPQAMANLQARVAALTGELAGVERNMLEAEAKHELLKLLEVRTRRDHDAAEQRMRDTRTLKEGASDDLTTLAKQVHEMRAAKEDAERVLGGVVMMYDQVRSDWHKKLKDRRQEVRELERRKAEDMQRREQQAALAAEKARIDAERAAKTKAERDAATARLSAVVPELEALEATWARLHGICGAATAEDVIAYWQELKAKEANMRELVRLAEVRESRAKQEMAALLAERAEVFDAADGLSARGEPSSAAMPEPSAPAGATAAPEPAEQAQQEHSTQDTLAGAEPAGEGEPAEAAVEQDEAAAQQDEAPQQAGPVAVAATVPLPAGSSVQEGDDTSPQQPAPSASASYGARPSQDEESAGESPAAAEAAGVQADGTSSAAASSPAEASAAYATVAAAAPAAAPAAPANPDVAAEQQHLLLRQAAIAEARRRQQTAKEKFAKLSQVCVAADQGLHLLALRLKAAMEPAGGADARRRTSMIGGRRMSSVHRRTTGQHQVVRRMSATQLMDQRGSITMLAAPGEPGSPRITVGAGIRDKDFFPELPGLLSDVSGRLGRLMQLVQHMEAASAAAAAAQAGAVSGGPSQGSLSSSMGTTEADEASLRAASSKKLKWADGQTTPPVEPSGQDSQEAVEEGEEDEEGGAAAADGEKALRKGFRRRTWAGPAWLDAVTAGKPLTAALRKQLGARSPGAGTAGGAVLTRVVGYVEDPGSSGDEGAGANPFDLAGSSDDELEEGGGLVDRQYLKHRAHALTNPKSKGRAGAAGGSPTIQVDARE